MYREFLDRAVLEWDELRPPEEIARLGVLLAPLPLEHGIAVLDAGTGTARGVLHDW